MRDNHLIATVRPVTSHAMAPPVAIDFNAPVTSRTPHWPIKPFEAVAP